MFQFQGSTKCWISKIPKCKLHATKYHFIRWKAIYKKVRSFQAIENNENTQQPLQYLMQANENEKSFLECPMLDMRKTFNSTMHTRMQVQFYFLFFQCNRANNALNDMKKNQHTGSRMLMWELKQNNFNQPKRKQNKTQTNFAISQNEERFQNRPIRAV